MTSISSPTLSPVKSLQHVRITHAGDGVAVDTTVTAVDLNKTFITQHGVFNNTSTARVAQAGGRLTTTTNLQINSTSSTTTDSVISDYDIVETN